MREEQATTLHDAIDREGHGRGAAQEKVGGLCWRMRNRGSPIRGDVTFVRAHRNCPAYHRRSP
jgi:hypothetical protein